MIDSLRKWFRSQTWWLKLRELQREGLSAAWRRQRLQRLIDGTPPVRTDRQGPVEVRVLTWRRDWRNVAWALKSFYHFAERPFPLVIHDGGLEPWQFDRLARHFPDAQILRSADADRQVEAELTRRGLTRSLEYRRTNVATKKVFDYFLLSQADLVLSIDSDIVFFRSPDELLAEPPPAKNLYNRDLDYAYSLTLEEIEREFGLRPPPLINSGLFLVHRASIDFDQIERWLAYPKLFENKWVTEQTLHALCSAVYGVELLPSTYLVSVEPGLSADLVCKHYPGTYRPLLYAEGMQTLIDQGFLRNCAAKPGAAIERLAP